MTGIDREPTGAREGDDAFTRTAGDLLRQSAAGIDATTASRLNRARQAALAELPRRRQRSPWLLPVLSTAAVGALAVGLWLGQGPGPERPATSSTLSLAPTIESAADMELLLAADNLEMLEDLEFYAWLDADLTDAERRAVPGTTG